MISQMTFAERSLLFAKLSGIAYQPEEQARAAALELGFTETEFYDKSGAQSYRFMNQDDIVIACRGTEPTQLNDISADLKAIKVAAETIGRVHMGFKSEVDELWPMVKEDLVAVGKTRTAWFTGHSLGAAMTTIMANRCHCDTTMPDIAEVYTYGSPRVGNNSYVCTFPVIHHRWVNNNDIVCRVPLAIMGYKHDGTMHYLNTWGNVRNPTGLQMFKDRMRGMWRGLKQGKIDNFGDHSITEYIKHLENYSQGKETEQI